MIYDKSFPVPARKRSVLTLPASRLRAGGKVRDAFLIHLKETDTGFVCAEGFQQIERPYPEEIYRLYAMEDELICLCKVPQKGPLGIYIYRHAYQYYNARLNEVYACFAVNLHKDEPTPRRWCVVNDSCSYIYGYEPTSAVNYSQNMGGGVGGLEYADRIFILQDNMVCYTQPFAEGNWEMNRNTDLRLSGKLPVTEKLGTFVGGAVLNDTAYFFLTYGVLKWKMHGDVLETETLVIPMKCGAVLRDTCRVADGHIYFFTEKGLCRFDGKTFEEVFAPCSRIIDFSAAVECSAFENKIYACVALKDGSRRVYVYDPRHERESFVDIEASTFSAMYSGYAVSKGELWEMTKRGLPPDGGPCRLCVRFLLGGDAPCTEWVRVEGEGEFTVEASTEEDGCAVAKGKSDSVLPFSRVLRGAVLTLTISSYSEDLRITGLSLGTAEEDRYDH